jgi:hypothetical protein
LLFVFHSNLISLGDLLDICSQVPIDDDFDTLPDADTPVEQKTMNVDADDAGPAELQLGDERENVFEAAINLTGDGDHNTVLEHLKGNTIDASHVEQFGAIVDPMDTPWFYTRAFPRVFHPVNEGTADNPDYVVRNEFTVAAPVVLQQRPKFINWAAHVVCEKSGRVAAHETLGLYLYSLRFHSQITNQAYYFLNQSPTEKNMSVEELQKHVNQPSVHFVDKLFRYTGNVSNSDSYWSQQSNVLGQVAEHFQHHHDRDATAFFTFSMAENHWLPLRILLAKIYNERGLDDFAQNIMDDDKVFQKAVDLNAHMVTHYFAARVEDYLSHVLTPEFGLDDYWYRCEFAPSRGAIHIHLYGWDKILDNLAELLDPVVEAYERAEFLPTAPDIPADDVDIQYILDNHITESSKANILYHEKSAAEMIYSYLQEQFGLSAQHPGYKDTTKWPQTEGSRKSAETYGSKSLHSMKFQDEDNEDLLDEVCMFFYFNLL